MPSRLGRKPEIAWSGTASGTPASRSTAKPTRMTTNDFQRNTAPRIATIDPSTVVTATRTMNRTSW